VLTIRDPAAGRPPRRSFLRLGTLALGGLTLGDVGRLRAREVRGLLPDVAVIMGGEFGRIPRIGDATADGRGHWPEAGFLWAAGGGLRTGQVIGGTDARGERRPAIRSGCGR
jgi:hypothetical protein